MILIFLSIQFFDSKYIHSVVQLSPPSISRTYFFSFPNLNSVPKPSPLWILFIPQISTAASHTEFLIDTIPSETLSYPLPS